MCHAVDIHGISFLFYLDFSFVLFGFNSYCLIQIPNGLLCSYIGILLFLDLKFLWSWIFGSVSALWDDVIKLTRSWKLVEFYSYGLIDSNPGKKKLCLCLIDSWLSSVWAFHLLVHLLVHPLFLWTWYLHKFNIQNPNPVIFVSEHPCANERLVSPARGLHRI